MQGVAGVLRAVGDHPCRRVSNEFDRAFDRRRSSANPENLHVSDDPLPGAGECVCLAVMTSGKTRIISGSSSCQNSLFAQLSALLSVKVRWAESSESSAKQSSPSQCGGRIQLSPLSAFC